MKDVRPTSERVLQALFNILGPMGGVRFLDLFAGTGRVGLEALRLGAASVVWVETSRSRSQAIDKKAADSSGRGTTTVLSLELRRALAWLRKRSQKFDFVFADPPYNSGWGETLLGIRGLQDVLEPRGTLIVEHSVREPLIMTRDWMFSTSRDYGETRLTFLTPAPEAEEDEGEPDEIKVVPL